MMPAAPLVLIVDDDAAVCWALRQALSQDGYSVAVAADAATARRLVRRHRPALVITDLRMPGDDGLTLLGSLRQHHPEVPVVLTTAYGTIDVAVQAEARGAFGYLPKPLDLTRTLAVVRSACGRQDLAISVAPGAEGHPLVGSSPAMQEVYRLSPPPRRARCRCSSTARRAPARSWWRTASTASADAPTGPSWR